MRNLFYSFQYREYVWLWLIVALTNTATWSFTLGVTWQIYTLTHSSSWSGGIMFASMVPNIFGGPIVGVLADKFDRRHIMTTASGAGILVLAVLAITTMMHVLSPIGMVGLTVLFGIASSGMSVSVNAMVPSLVPKERLYNAYSLQAVGQRGTEFVGPILAAPLLAAFGPQAVYLFSGLAYAITLYVISRLAVAASVKMIVVEKAAGFVASLAAGFKYIRHTRGLLQIVSLVGLHCALTMSYLGVLPAFVLHLGAQSSFYGVLMSMIGLGAIAGTLFLAGLQSQRVRFALYWISAVLSGLSLAFLGASWSDGVAIIAILIVGSSQALFMTLAIALIQEITVDRMRGRVTSVYFVLAGGFMSVANWAYGVLGTFIEPRTIMMTIGLLFTVIAGAYWIWELKSQYLSLQGQQEDTVSA